MFELKTAKITIGIVFGKNDLKYLPYTLKSIFVQTYTDFEVILHNNVLAENDVAEDDRVWKWIEENYPQVKLERSGNIGFGSAHNAMMRQMQGDYYLCCNPDILLEKDFLEQLIAFVNNKKEEKIGLLGGELRYWDFAKRDEESQGKTDLIDSLGLKIKKTHQVVDISQGEKSIKNYELGITNCQEEEVFGVSGALFLVSRKALEAVSYKSPLRGLGGVDDVEVKNHQMDTAQESRKKNIKVQVGDIEPTLVGPAMRDEPASLDSRLRGNDKIDQFEYFDELIFLYKEDVDLAYRLKLAGFEAFLVKKAVAYHDRSVAGNQSFWQNRKNKKRLVKGQTINTWSFYHQHLLLYKNWQKGFSLRVKGATLGYEILSNLYLLFFEFNTFWNGWKLFKKNFTEIKKRKRMTVKKIEAGEIEKWMR